MRYLKALAKMHSPWIGLIAVLAALFLRMTTEFEPRDFLWAEDATVFLNGALTQGKHSLFAPYAGYIHLYPRLVALLACQFDLIWAPTIFFAGWIFAVIALVSCAWLFFRRLNIKPAVAFLAVCLILVQPHSGEIFYNLTNVQWMTGFTLPLVALIDFSGFARIAAILYIVVTTLTGPFAIMLAPVLILRLWLRRNARPEDVLVFAGAAVQLTIYLTSARGNGEVADPHWQHWVSAIWTFLTFGSQYFVIQLFSLVFWGAIVAGFRSEIRRSGINRALTNLPTLLLLFGLIVFMASLWAAKTIPDVITPRGSGARYFFVPYAAAIVFFAARQNVQPRHGFTYLIGLLVLFMVHFVSVGHENRQFRAYQAIAAIEPRTRIPVQPNGWSFFIEKHSHRQNYSVRFSEEITFPISLRSAAAMELSLEKTRNCNPGEFVAIEIAGSRRPQGNYEIIATGLPSSRQRLLGVEIKDQDEQFVLAYIQPMEAPAIIIRSNRAEDWKSEKIRLLCIHRS